MRIIICVAAILINAVSMAQNTQVWEETARGQFQKCFRESQPENPLLAGGTANRSKVIENCKNVVEDLFQEEFTLRQLTGTQPLADEAEAWTVSFKFAWPTGIDAIVNTSKISSKSLNGDEVINKIDSKARLSTEAHGEGIAVRRHDVESVVEITPEDQGPGTVINTLLAQVLELSPDVLADAEGQATNIDKTEKTQGQARKLFSGAAATLKSHFSTDELSMLQQMVDHWSSPEQLQDRAFARWRLEVGQWHGITLAAGAPTRVDTWITLASLGDFAIKSSNNYVLKERVACNNQETAKNCVHIVVESTLKPGELGHINEKLGRRATAQEVTNDHNLSIIMEPETLLLHRVEENKTSKIVFAGDGEGNTIELESEQRVAEYRYLQR